ncbi:RNA polymerase sigma-70 factor (ECF subfamily) [Nocardioides sp. J9]|uniref:RNA polymerase sigma factor SigJ n=1 Tax=Nocardioides sp. J9 TaxID=935844 RepID=UPI0011A5FCCC|nr:RNA polymerase sigma factor SigJ [Nocardioides sp. J9]TWH00544.1 RNA polymerase sigma-70 factor (ECF subfamily) [Nocardioides sp. J9]
MTSPTEVPTIDAERPRLVNLAYRMLGSLTEAEDAVQEAYARWFALAPDDRAVIESPPAWLTTVTSRVCLDHLGSARARRETYVGEWLPELLPDPRDPRSPAPAAGHTDPADRVTLDESVSTALLVVMESMTPAERVAFVLHDVFGFQFPEVAEVLERSPAACRQLASSARRRVRDAEVSPTAPAHQAEVVQQIKQAWQAGDVAALLDILAEDAVTVTDGGGIVHAQLHPVSGASEVAQLLLRNVPDGLDVVETPVNGEPGLVVQRDGTTLMVVAFGIAGDHVRHIWATLNPEKLRPWGGLESV